MGPSQLWGGVVYSAATEHHICSLQSWGHSSKAQDFGFNEPQVHIQSCFMSLSRSQAPSEPLFPFPQSGNVTRLLRTVGGIRRDSCSPDCGGYHPSSCLAYVAGVMDTDQGAGLSNTGDKDGDLQVLLQDSVSSRPSMSCPRPHRALCPSPGPPAVG